MNYIDNATGQRVLDHYNQHRTTESHLPVANGWHLEFTFDDEQWFVLTDFQVIRRLAKKGPPAIHVNPALWRGNALKTLRDLMLKKARIVAREKWQQGYDQIHPVQFDVINGDWSYEIEYDPSREQDLAMISAQWLDPS